MYHIIMNGQENLEPRIINDIFGNVIAIGIAQHLGSTSIYVWHNVAVAPIMIESKKIDLLIDELIDEKIRALDLEKEHTGDDLMYVTECCGKIVYGDPNRCVYCDIDD